MSPSTAHFAVNIYTPKEARCGSTPEGVSASLEANRDPNECDVESPGHKEWQRAFQWSRRQLLNL